MKNKHELKATLYTRQGCHLCDEAYAMLAKYEFDVTSVDIDDDQDLTARYGNCVPVVVMHGKERFRGRINEVLLRRLIVEGRKTSRHLGVFAKYWEAGKVKTRLAATIGNASASSIYRRCLQHLIGRLEDFADFRTLAFSPPEHQADFESLVANDWELWPQPGGNLGQRMQKFFAHAFSRGARQVVLMGSDSPTMPLEYLHEAYRRLETHRVVLGPACDGGYYLVGASTGTLPIFDGVDWGTSAVWNQTIERIKQSQLTFSCLNPWYDVDDYSDLVRLHNELLKLVEVDDSWRELLQTVEVVLQEQKTRYNIAN